MTCENCDPGLHTPGRIIKVTKSLNHCSNCGDKVVREWISQPTEEWDTYFHSICDSVATKSPCLSRKIGAILVRDKSIISTGYNGPPRGIPHCGHERFMKDKVLQGEFSGDLIRSELISTDCPRQILGYESGTHMELCPAQHAEENVISNAARLGVGILGSTLYINSIIPCKNCFGTLINTGVVEVVIKEAKVYDEYTQFLIDNSNILIREFKR